MQRFPRALTILVVVLLALSGTSAQFNANLLKDHIHNLDFESWECDRTFVPISLERIVLERMFYPPNKLAELSERDRKETPEFLLDGRGIGSISSTLAIPNFMFTRVRGLDLEWRDEYGLSSFTIQANGIGIYKYIHRLGAAEAESYYECHKLKLSQKKKQTAKLAFLDFLKLSCDVQPEIYGDNRNLCV